MKYLYDIKQAVGKTVEKVVLLNGHEKLFIEFTDATALLIVMARESSYETYSLWVNDGKKLTDYEQLEAGVLTREQFDLDRQKKDKLESAQRKADRRLQWELLNKEFAPEQTK
jgi:hypothetical protein